jgi:ubiquinone/menaquinone biosynthesis C-methylase UbiE
MESSKAAAARLVAHVDGEAHLLDVGCGAGHYYRSIRRVLTEHARPPLRYTGIDATSYYIRRARDAFGSDPQADFLVGDIYCLPFADCSFDLVLCANVLLHLPSIARPLEELCRVARRFALIRTLVAERTFIIREVRGSGDELDYHGEPHQFNWYNIYSRAYVAKLIDNIPCVQRCTIEVDRDFNSHAIEAAAAHQTGAENPTRMLGGWQVNGCILQPWCFIKIELSR